MQLAVWREKPDDVEMLTVAAKRAFDDNDAVARAHLLNEAAIMTVGEWVHVCVYVPPSACLQLTRSHLPLRYRALVMKIALPAKTSQRRPPVGKTSSSFMVSFLMKARQHCCWSMYRMAVFCNISRTTQL